MSRVWSIEYGVSGLVPFQVAGGGPGWQVAGMLRSRGDRMIGSVGMGRAAIAIAAVRDRRRGIAGS